VSYVVSFKGVRPTPRFDEDPWVEAHLQEAPDSTGTWTTIEQYTLVPDSNPARPDYRDFSSDAATLANGWYRFVFFDASGDASQPTDPVFVGGELNFRPQVTDVAALIRTRTRDMHGNELGTFNEDTTPTAANVDSIIDGAVRWVQQRVGMEVCEAVVGMVRDTVALRAAMQVELTFFPEQVSANRSPYQQMKDLMDEDLKVLIEAVRQQCSDGGEILGPTDDAQLPRWGFPEDRGGMVGWQSRW
jgi:hypothetical protein